MCGIVGILGDPDRDLLEVMAESVRHRGPDDAGVYLTPSVGIAARRLSIVDLSGGHQPLANEDETIWVVQNGEIYNYPELRNQLVAKGHRFKTKCDTELLVHGYEEWGDEMPGRLRGMFAIALWDERKRQLFLARDRMGIKPLYLSRNQSGLVFASEIRALLRSPLVDRELSLEGIHHYLTLQAVPPPLTIFEDI